MIEIPTIISSFSHILNIKGKFSPEKTTVVSLENKNESIKKYCSIYMEHSFDPRYIGLNEKEEIKLILAKRCKFTIPILRIDWVFMETKHDSFMPYNTETPNMLLIKDKGKYIIAKDLSNILRLHIDDMGLKGKKLKKALDTLVLQCTFADGHKVPVQAQQSLKESLYTMHAKTSIKSV